MRVWVPIGLLLRIVCAPVIWIGNAIGRAWWRRQDRLAGPPLPGFMLRDSRSMIDGVMIEIGTVGRPRNGGWPDVSARARRPNGVVFVRERAWGDRDRPAVAAAAAALPVLDDATHGDDDASIALPAFAAMWDKLASLVEHAILASDGDEVVGWIVADRQEQVDALAALVAAVARWDAKVAAMLVALPEARPLYDGPYSPCVLLPGDVRVGLRDDRLLVALGTRSRAVERDPARIAAAVAELRAARSSAPFR